MWRTLVYIAVLCAAALGAVWLSNLSGEVTITLATHAYDIDLPVAAALLIALGLVIALLWWFLASILRLPSLISSVARNRRRAKGYQALSRGMVAIGSGDSGQARRHAKEAQRLLGEEPLTLLLNAQVAQVSGDLPKAEAVFRKMAANQETKLVGLRGLFIEARRLGDQTTAYRYAREAAELAPAVDWANEAVLEAQCTEGAWGDALTMVDKRAAFGLIDKETAKRQRAVLLTADAYALRQNMPEKALENVQRALKYAPTLIPAAVLAGQLLGQRNDVRKASKLLEKAWVATPHPDIADTYIRLRLGDSAQDRLKRAETLGRLANGHPESRLAIAQAALEAREFKRAREILQPLLTERPSIRTCLFMADLEEAEHGAVGHVREWLSRAARAPRDPAWIADGLVSEQWAPFSPLSGRIDAFQWQTPPEVLSAPLLPDPPPAPSADVLTIIPSEAVSAPLIEGTLLPPAEPAPVAEQDTNAAPLPELSSSEENSAEPEPLVEPTPAPLAEAPSQELPQDEVKPEATPELETQTAPAPAPEVNDKKTPKDKKPAFTPQPVVFPVLHAPDDPGIEEDKKTR